MLPKFLNSTVRVAGFIISAILLVQPWLIATNTSDPFLYTGWAGFLSAFISLLCISLVFVAFKPQKGYITTNPGLLFLFIAISIALYFTPYRVCLRESLFGIGLIFSLWSLRLFRKNEDNFSIGGMIALSGFFMSVYAICQINGNDFLVWESKYQVVGTLTNPNFLGIFLCITSAITFGMFAELYSKSKKHSLTFLAFFITQITVILMLQKSGLLICLAFMTILWICSRWFKFSGKISKKTPIIAGLILAVIFLTSQWLIYRATSAYEWEKITKVSTNAQTVVSRLILWKMGFEIFLKHKFTGAGVGAVSDIMPLQRPPVASTLGLNIYNDNPHSFVVTSLAETGFLGLLGLSTLLVSIYGCYIRKNTFYEEVEITKETPIEDKKDSENLEIINFPWINTAIAVLILYLGFQSRFVKSYYIPSAISAVIFYFGVSTSIKNRNYVSSKNDFRFLGRSTLTAILGFTFYSLFNNTFSIIPLSAFIVLIASLHYSCCQPDVRWKPRITGISFLFLLFPIFFGISAYYTELNYEKETNAFSEGATALSQGNWQEAEAKLKEAIQINPQCLKAYYGLALALDALKQPELAQDYLLKLDTMVPNIFNVKYEIARILFENNKILEAHRYAIKNLEWSETPLAYEMLGNILLREGRYNDAEHIFKESLVSIPKNTKERLATDRIRLSLAALASERGDFKNCKKYLNAIKTEVAENLDAIYLKGMLLTREKKYDEALLLFNKAIELYPHVPRILNAVGYLLLVTNKDLERAQILLEEAYSLVRTSEKVVLADLLMVANSLGKLYHKQNKLKQAGELLKLSYEGTPEEWKALKKERLNDLNAFFDSFESAK